jgi:putative hydrolase of the HAD superfamily
LALRAAIFDYGMVLSNPPDSAAHAQLLRITGLPAEKLDPLYWADRHAFDEGKLTGESYWRGVLQKAGIALGPAAVTELMEWDARMWLTSNQAMVSWALSLRARGMLTAILSNIGDTVSQAIEREVDWLSRFDLYVWSYQLRLAKPDPAIFRYTLGKLGVRPKEALFLDDRAENVEAAAALGIHALVFTTVERLRADLVAAGFDNDLPLPATA